MTEPGAMFVVQRTIFARQLRECLSKQGAAATGVVIEAALAAIVEHLRRTQGPEAAFNVIARHTDQASAPLLDLSTLKHGD